MLSCFSTVRTALGKLRITGLLMSGLVRSPSSISLGVFQVPTALCYCSRLYSSGIRKAPNHVPHLPIYRMTQKYSVGQRILRIEGLMGVRASESQAISVEKPAFGNGLPV